MHRKSLPMSMDGKGPVEIPSADILSIPTHKKRKFHPQNVLHLPFLRVPSTLPWAWMLKALQQFLCTLLPLWIPVVMQLQRSLSSIKPIVVPTDSIMYLPPMMQVLIYLVLSIYVCPLLDYSSIQLHTLSLKPKLLQPSRSSHDVDVNLHLVERGLPMNIDLKQSFNELVESAEQNLTSQPSGVFQRHQSILHGSKYTLATHKTNLRCHEAYFSGVAKGDVVKVSHNTMNGGSSTGSLWSW